MSVSAEQRPGSTSRRLVFGSLQPSWLLLGAARASDRSLHAGDTALFRVCDVHVFGRPGRSVMLGEAVARPLAAAGARSHLLSLWISFSFPLC